MSFKLSKEDITRRDGYVEKLNAAVGVLDDAIRVYNEEVEKLRDGVNASLDVYNQIVEEARGFAEDIANQADTDISDKSEKWQDGEKGQAAIAWKNEWESLAAELNEITIEWPDELTVEAPEHADALEQAPVEAEG